MTPEERIQSALNYASAYGGIDGGHHKMWVIDQMVRALTGCPVVSRSAADCRGAPYNYETQGESEEYQAWIVAVKKGEDGPDSYDWDEGTPP